MEKVHFVAAGVLSGSRPAGRGVLVLLSGRINWTLSINWP